MNDETETLSEGQLEQITTLLDFAAKKLELAENTEMSVTFVNNETIQTINREYRDKDQATDVISFALEELGDGEIPVVFEEEMDLPRNLGDLFVSVEKAQTQAQEYGHTFERELGFLVVHGFLHLNGYDHMTEEDEKEMFTLQRKILEEYGLKR